MWARVLGSLTTLPTARDWRLTLAVTVTFGGLALAFSLLNGFLQAQPAPASILPLALRVLIVPSLTEELVFRVLPPRRYALLALVLYVLYHPLMALLFVPVARPVFWDIRFLLLAALLGGCCTLLYHRTGSVWPPTLLHWAAVTGWLEMFGGEAALRPHP